MTNTEKLLIDTVRVMANEILSLHAILLRAGHPDSVQQTVTLTQLAMTMPGQTTPCDETNITERVFQVLVETRIGVGAISVMGHASQAAKEAAVVMACDNLPKDVKAALLAPPTDDVPPNFHDKHKPSAN